MQLPSSSKQPKSKLRLLVFLTGLFAVAVLAWFYFNEGNMTFRQKMMKAIYPLIMWGTGKQAKKISNEGTLPTVPFYSLTMITIDGAPFSFEQLRGKKVMLVNTASDCGYTGQYEALQALADRYQDKLVVIGFPANDFKQQERGSNKEIAQFCKKNYGVRFPLMEKSTVIKSASQNPVYRWLTDAGMNGWNTKAPSWNFSKYLVNEAGVLTHYFDPAVSPLDDEVTNAVER